MPQFIPAMGTPQNMVILAFRAFKDQWGSFELLHPCFFSETVYTPKRGYPEKNGYKIRGPLNSRFIS